MIKTTKKLISTSTKKNIISILNYALTVCEPQQIVEKYLKKYSFWKKYKNIYIIGFGKAAYPMALGAEKILKTKIKAGAVIAPSKPKNSKLKKIKILLGSHPLPNKTGINSSQQIFNLTKNIGKKDLVICLISGGGSSLFTLPASGIKLEDLKKTFELLIKYSAANIHEINVIRKHISQVKGGQLTRLLYPAKTHSLIISDVIGNKLSTIASGPTVPDNSNFKHALAILKKYKLDKKIPKSVLSHLRKGIKKQITDTPTSQNKIFKKVKNVIIGDNYLALQAAKKKAKKFKYKPIVMENFLQEEVKDSVKEFITILNIIKPNTCLIAGGETTVNVKGNGRGGRNQEFAMQILKHLPKELQKNITLATLATDGIDGFCPIPIAGALIDQHTKENIKKLKLNLNKFIRENNSYNLFRKLNSQIITGPTNTNVMDIVVAIKNPDK